MLINLQSFNDDTPSVLACHLEWGGFHQRVWPDARVLEWLHTQLQLLRALDQRQNNEPLTMQWQITLVISKL